MKVTITVEVGDHRGVEVSRAAGDLTPSPDDTLIRTFDAAVADARRALNLTAPPSGEPATGPVLQRIGEDSTHSGPTRRLRSCVERWPDCWTCGYDPSCCRFPKSCSCTVYDPEQVSDDDLEAP